MKYKIGDKVRVRGDLEVDKKYGEIVFLTDMKKGEIFDVLSISGSGVCELNDVHRLYYSPEMLRPAEFKIWCETEEEKQAVLEELEKEGYTLKKMTSTIESKKAPMFFLILHDGILYGTSREAFEEEKCVKISPSEFTRIDFQKIVITKTKTGAVATYGDKTVTTEGEFKEASRQALAEVLCPFRVGEWVQHKYNWNIRGMVAEISSDMEVRVCSGVVDTWLEFEEIEPCKEPLFSGRVVFVEDSVEFTKGKIYEFTDGTVRDNGGYIKPIPPKIIRNEKDLQEYGFIAIVENK